MVSGDPETFAKAVRVACITEEEHGRFLEEQEPLPTVQPSYTVCEILEYGVWYGSLNLWCI